MSIRANARSPYMQWSKLRSTAKYNLATSGLVGLPLAELGVSIDQLEINGPTVYGYDVLLAIPGPTLSGTTGMCGQCDGNIVLQSSCARRCYGARR